MIYDEAEATSPIGQGDIFTNIPILELPSDDLAVIDENDGVITVSWEVFFIEYRKNHPEAMPFEWQQT